MSLAEETTQEPVEEIQEDVTPQEEMPQIDEGTEEASQEPQEKPQKPNKSLDDRLKELSHKTWEMREAERRAKEETEKLEKLQEQFGQVKPPNPDDFDDVEKFNEQKSKYEEHIIEQKAHKLAQERFQEQQQQADNQRLAQKWEYEKLKAIEKDPAFAMHESKVEQVLKMNGRIAYAQPILQSDKAADIVTYLGKNTEHLERFATLSPEMALKELGILEYKLGQQPIKKTAKAPEPISPVDSGGGAPKTLAQMSYREFEAHRNKQQFGR